VARVYRQSFAAFYLPTRPPLFKPPVTDYRLLPGSHAKAMSSEVAFDVRQSLDRRSISLELYSDLHEAPPEFTSRADLSQDPEAIAVQTREQLGITIGRQREWRDPRVAFNSWRAAIERLGVLVFQAVGIALDEMRGYSIAQFPLPIVVVNRKDSPAGRIFSLLHEYAHLLLRSSGICDLEIAPRPTSAEQKTEVFCNFVAGATAVPRAELLMHPVVRQHRGKSWADEDILEMARFFCVSREVVVRRLLILGLTTESFYTEKRQIFQKEYAEREIAEGFVPPSTNIVSAAGKPFVRLVLNSFNSDLITSSDVSDYLGVKLSHLDKIAEAAMTE